jgi:hypothetical protein
MKTNTNEIYRQGDVLIERVAELPRNTKAVKRENGLIILARGEATGHHHSISEGSCALLEVPGVTDRFLRVAAGGAAVEHQEHDTITLPGPAKYRVRRQREYTPEAIRNVAD